MAKRGYTSETIRGGASDWDVSRPFSSYLRLLGTLISHPARFFEVLPKVQDPRAPGLFLAFSGMLSAIVWFFFWGWAAALGALVLTLPASLAVAGICHLGAFGGRHEYLVTWRTVAYPFGFALPLMAVPVARWVALVFAGLLVIPVGLRVVQEIPAARAFLVSAGVSVVLGVVLFFVAGP